MGLLKIIANSIELDFVKESLSIKTENNAFTRDFKISASSYPFLIVENRNTKLALGTRDLASVKKNKTIKVTVFEGGNKFYGELQVLSYLEGFRKCNLKYSSIIFSLMNKKISEFMPVISVIPNEVNPIPFAEESDQIIEGSEYWQKYPLPFLNANFPEAKWQFPTMNWFNKFGVALEPTDEWFLYKNKINEYDNNGLILNAYNRNGNVITVANKNVVSPQIFLLTPLYYALKTINFKAIGTAVENEFLKRLLLLSTKNNLTETRYIKLEFPPLSPFSNVPNSWTTSFYYNITTPGKYSIKYYFEENTFPTNLYGRTFSIWWAGGIIYTYTYGSNKPSQVFEGIVEFEVTGQEGTNQLAFNYVTRSNQMPIYSLSSLDNDNVYHQMHPTIQLGRYLPDWTFGTYLNEIQNLFNLEITPDDFSQTVNVNFNEESIVNGATHNIKKSLKIIAYDHSPYNAFLLKYDNDEDEALWVTSESTEIYNTQTSDFSEKLGSKFKYVPVTTSANLSEEIESKGGVGLMIYDPENKPNISEDFLGQTLKMNGDKGIYQVFWKKFLKFLFKSSSVELTGPFTENEKNKILKLKRIFIDHQEYMVSSIESSETQQENFNIKFNLLTVTF